jgi:hypothetical protein
MDELSEADRRNFCRWQADLYGGPGSAAPCGSGTFKIPAVDDCAKSANSFLHVSVAITEACIDELQAQGDICSLPSAGACADVKAARAAKPPSNGSCGDDRWSMEGCQVPDFF